MEVTKWMCPSPYSVRLSYCAQEGRSRALVYCFCTCIHRSSNSVLVLFLMACLTALRLLGALGRFNSPWRSRTSELNLFLAFVGVVIMYLCDKRVTSVRIWHSRSPREGSEIRKEDRERRGEEKREERRGTNPLLLRVLASGDHEFSPIELVDVGGMHEVLD